MKVVDQSGAALGVNSDSVKSVPIETENSRSKPRQIGIGAMRGQQTFLNIDGSKITLGIIPGTNNEFGIAFFDPQGNVVQKILGGTTYVYNPADDYHNITQAGLLPDGSGGFVVANEGLDVADVFD